MSVKNGVDYLMRFTRYAFLLHPILKCLAVKNALTPEQTLMYDQSDCEDRVAVFLPGKRNIQFAYDRIIVSETCNYRCYNSISLLVHLSYTMAINIPFANQLRKNKTC